MRVRHTTRGVSIWSSAAAIALVTACANTTQTTGSGPDAAPSIDASHDAHVSDSAVADTDGSADAADVTTRDAGAVRTPPLRLMAPAGFAPDTLYFGADIYQISRTGLVLDEMARDAALDSCCIESPDGQRAQWMLGGVLPWNVMVDDPDAWTRVRAGLDAARAAGVPIQIVLDISHWPSGLAAAAEAEARGERLCAGYPCSVPFSPTSTAFWDAAAQWQAEAARALDAYLGDPVVLLFVMGEPSIDVPMWRLPVPPTTTASAWVPLQLRLLEQRMVASMQGAVRGRVSVSIRHSPWFLSTPYNQLRWGVRPEDFNALCDESLAGGIMGVDVYETPGMHVLDDAIITAQRYCTRFQGFFGGELGVVDGAIARGDMFRWAQRIRVGASGQPSSLLGASVYCWNCIPDPGAPPTALSSDARRWLGEAFHSMVDGPTHACAPRCAAHPTWTSPTGMSVAVGSTVQLQTAMSSPCDSAEVFVQGCCHTGNCNYAQGLDEDADCPLLARGIPVGQRGEARVTFDAATYRPGWVRVRARAAGAQGAPPSVRVQLMP